MKISVITVVYNDVKNIENTLLSVINQTAFNYVEYIIIDGASNDGTSDIIKKYCCSVTKYICEPDSGIYNAMNKGLMHASGDYIMFLNSGDKFTSKHIIDKLLAAIGDTNPDVVYGNYREVSVNGNISRIIPCRNKNKIWYGPVASHQSTIYRLQHLRNHKFKYDESYRIAADYKLTAQAIVSASKVHKMNICISDFDINGISSTNQDLGLSEANRVRREVFGWNYLSISALSIVLLAARYTKKFLFPIYRIIRY